MNCKPLSGPCQTDSCLCFLGDPAVAGYAFEQAGKPGGEGGFERNFFLSETKRGGDLIAVTTPSFRVSGHLPPKLTLVNGAVTQVKFDGKGGSVKPAGAAIYL